MDSVSPPIEHSETEYEMLFGHLAQNWEYEPGFWLNKPSEVKRMVEAVGHDNFKLLFDTSHAYMELPG